MRHIQKGKTMLASLSALALLALAAAAPAKMGPPWVSIEYPVNPYDATQRGAYLLVHEFHHATQMRGTVEGTAEGLVRGERRSITLAFDTTSRAGVLALRKQWPDDGTWSLVIKVSAGHDNLASAMVDIGVDGNVAAVRVPTERRDRYELPRAISSREIDSTLSAHASRQTARR